jgi:hypothetical protein
MFKLIVALTGRIQIDVYIATCRIRWRKGVESFIISIKIKKNSQIIKKQTFYPMN